MTKTKELLDTMLQKLENERDLAKPLRILLQNSSDESVIVHTLVDIIQKSIKNTENKLQEQKLTQSLDILHEIQKQEKDQSIQDQNQLSELEKVINLL